MEKVRKNQFESKFQLYEVTLWLTVGWGLAVFQTDVCPVGEKKTAQHDYEAESGEEPEASTWEYI